jgi:ribosome recycling factor
MADEFIIDTDDLQRRMDGALSAVKGEFASLRTGRASSSMLDPITLEVYGQKTPLNQLGTINVPEPRMVTVNVWDKTNVPLVEKAIRESGLGINPQLNGTIIMLPIPELNEERRRELSKVAGQYAESARVAVRNIRRDGMDQIKKAKSDGCLRMIKSFGKSEVQEMTDDYVKRIDSFLNTKQDEIMQV